MDIHFVGEHLLPGRIGHFAVIFSFGTALFAALAYFFAARNKDLQDNSWQNLARWAFRLHSVAVITIVASLFTIIYKHYFEYHYAWAHSSLALPTHFMISCFWEGQEGSFLLWAFWQLVLGNILIYTAKNWESPVMAVVSLSQVFICSMLIGVEIFGQKIGSSPFILLRDALDAPIFKRADYLSLIQDGNGLNPLLQNYWMVIHPPTLFLGFASMVVPFAYVIASLWQKRYSEWIKPAMPWTLFAVMVLGTGIIMGSFWAYEALNFGGFWAWDPVENASMIPWLTLIAGLHVMIAYKSTGHAYFTASFLVFISFVLVLYASFLTRSGILGETSVHAFTDLGMSGQLVIYLLVFLALGATLFIRNWKELPITEKDEATYSREFWLFVGSLVLTISCFQVILTTSIPVANKLFGTNFAPPINVIQHYNKWQIPIAVLVTIIAGFSQFLKYKQSDKQKFYVQLGVTAVASALIAIVVIYFGKFYTNIQYSALIFAGIFGFLANARILTDALSGKLKLAGSALAHMGFALLLLGALIAASRSEVISINSSNIGYGKEFDAKNTRENILLWKNEGVTMNGYLLTYLGDSTSGPNTYYRVNYKKLNGEGKVTESFDLYPNAQINPKMGLVASPDTKHYLLHDIYTHVSSVPAKEEEHAEGDDHAHSDSETYKKPVVKTLAVGDSMLYSDGVIILSGLNKDVHIKDIKLTNNDIGVGARLEIISKSGHYTAEPVFIMKDNFQFGLPASVEDEGLKFYFSAIDPATRKIEISLLEKKEKQRDYIIMKAILFPYINLFWGGTIIMVIGFILSIVRRIQDNQ